MENPSGTSSTSSPKIAIEPSELQPFFEGAVKAGGGEVVDLAEASAMIWADTHNIDGLAATMGRAPQIDWVQLPSAGVEKSLHLLDGSRVWTSAKGIYGDTVAEFALGLALAGMRDIGQFARADAPMPKSGRSLIGRRVTILGAGGLASSLVRILGPFDCHIRILRRSQVDFPGADFTGTLADLSEVLPRTDVLFLTLPLTPETDGIINAARLAELPRDAWIINVARGRHIVTDDLVEALTENRIGGAALDVTDPEPLPAGHPLWSLPNCIVTPHTANTPAMAFGPLEKRVTENVRRYAAGEELLGVVDPNLGY